MTTTLDIPENLLARARQLTHATSDQEAILRAVEAFAARGEPTSSTATPTLLPPVDNGAAPYTQAELIALLGTFSGFDISDEEDHYSDLR